MGTATIGAYTLQSVVKIERAFRKTVAEHEIPGTASIMQAVARKRDVIKIHGILNPSSEVTAVQNIATVTGQNTTAFSALAVTDAAGTDWVGLNSNTYFLEDVQIQTQEGTAVPWGRYTVSLVEVGP